MIFGDKRRLLLVSMMLAVAGFVTACETTAEREARLEREAYIKTLDLEELKNQLDTVNPDPYAGTPTKPARRHRRRN